MASTNLEYSTKQPSFPAEMTVPCAHASEKPCEEGGGGRAAAVGTRFAAERPKWGSSGPKPRNTAAAARSPPQRHPSRVGRAPHARAASAGVACRLRSAGQARHTAGRDQPPVRGIVYRRQGPPPPTTRPTPPPNPRQSTARDVTGPPSHAARRAAHRLATYDLDLVVGSKASLGHTPQHGRVTISPAHRAGRELRRRPGRVWPPLLAWLTATWLCRCGVAGWSAAADFDQHSGFLWDTGGVYS